MTRRRWIADEVSGDRAALTGAHAYHLCRVLRARVGQQFDIATASGVRRGCVSSVEEARVEFDLLEEIPAAVIPPVTLALAVFKFDRMEWAIEKCTELGVARIVPIAAQRTERHLAGAAANRVERWRRVAQQASEQARRAAPPEILPPMSLKEALQVPAELRIVLDETERAARLTDLLAEKPSGHLWLAVGPEGGWTVGELDAFHGSGWLSASLGGNILRAETAAIVAVTLALYEPT